MALDHRIQVREQDLSQFATLQTNETGAMVIVAPKGTMKPKRNNNGKDILRRYGNPSAEHWGTFEALGFVSAAPLYVACAIGAGARYAGVDVNISNVTGFGYGRPDPANVDFSAIPVPITPYQFGTGNGSATVFSGTVPTFPIQEGSLQLSIGGVDIATADAAGVITGAGITAGTINYTNGAISVTFATAPVNGAAVSVAVRQIQDKSASIAFSLFKASPYNDSYERYDIQVSQVTGVPGVQYQATLLKVAGGASTQIGSPYRFSLLQEKDAFGRSTYIHDVFEESDYIIPVVNEDFAGTVALVSTPAVAEITDVTFVAEAGGGVASNYYQKYFLYENTAGTAKYVLWFRVDTLGTAPIIPGRTAVMVDVTAADTAGTIAGAVQAAIDALPDIAASVAGPIVTLTQDVAGACVDVANGGVGNAAPVTIAVTTQGANAINGSAAVTMTGGYRGAAPQASDFLAAWQQFEAYNRYRAKILMDVYGNSANTIRTMQSSVLPYTHAITTIPMGNTVSQAISFRAGLSINWDKMSIYYNFHRIQDPYNNSTAWVSGVGKIGAKYAAMEDVYDSLSPAGIDENGHGGQLFGFTPIEVEYDLQPQDKLDLDAAQINGIVLDDEDGLMVIGDWTMQTTLSDTSYIGTRRLYNLLLETISKQVLRRQVFKNNDTFHRLKAFNVVDTLLTPVRAGEFLFDYRIQCDLDNNDAPVRNQRQFVLDVYVQAQTNSQEVLLNFIRLPQGDVLASLNAA